MKFGKSIGSQQEGDSELHYIDYKVLKKSIKDVVELLQTNGLSEALTANHGFEEELAGEIQQVNGCFGQRQRELMDEIAAFADTIQAEPTLIEDQAGSNPLRQDGPFRRLVGILGDVDRLRKYAVWNAVAVVKILKKRRKQTNFGLEDVAAERAGWLSRQSFFSGSDFAELHTAIESLGHLLVRSELAQSSDSMIVPSKEREVHQCPICLDNISDMVELSCNHRFCWKCFVLGPIAFQPGEYRITQCPICREETSAPDLAQGIGMPTSEGILTRFLHTYFPKELASREGGMKAQMEAHLEGEESEREMRDVVGELVKALLGDSQWEPPAKEELVLSHSCGSSCGPRDFFHTLPAKPSKCEKNVIGNAQKLQWLQLASYQDPLALDNAAICSLCSEPLLMEAVATTPCKHYFHRVCVTRVDMPECPLCHAALPFSWFLPPEHPCYESGFRVAQPSCYRPTFPGGPSKGSAAYLLQRPPPINLLGPGGMQIRSYLHSIPPTGTGDCHDEMDTGLSGTSTNEPDEDSQSDVDDSSAASSSSDEREDSESEVEDESVETAAKVLRKSKMCRYAYSVFGKMQLAERGSGDITFQPPPAPTALPASSAPQVLLIDHHV